MKIPNDPPVEPADHRASDGDRGGRLLAWVAAHLEHPTAAADEVSP